MVICLAVVLLLRHQKLAVVAGLVGAIASFLGVVVTTALLAHARRSDADQGKE